MALNSVLQESYALGLTGTLPYATTSISRSILWD